MKLLPLLFAAALLLPVPPAAADASSSSSSAAPRNGGQRCTAEISAALSREYFLFHATLLGLKEAAKEREGAVRVSEDGQPWLKTDLGWVSAGEGVISDSRMDQKTPRDPVLPPGIPLRSTVRRGILETQNALTSDLIPPLLQSFRALQCRTDSVCHAAELLLLRKVPLTATGVHVALPGCREMDIPLMPSCIPGPLMSFADYLATPASCAPIQQEMTEYASAELRELIHEDAAHRTLRQFAGTIEPFLQTVRFPLLLPLRQVSDFFRQWTAKPCFLPFCAQE